MTVDASTRTELARSLLSAAHALESSMASALRGSDLGVPHFLIMSHLAEHGAAATSDLGRIALVPPATLTRALDKLVDLALVHRALDAEDRRRIMVRLTERGHASLSERATLVDDAIAAALPALRAWEAEALTDLLGPRKNGA